MSIPYVLIDHTADFGIHVTGTNLTDLYGNAAMALFDLIYGLKAVEKKHLHHIRVDGDDLPDLMINWLRELLYLWNGEQKLVAQIDQLEVDKSVLSADVLFDIYDVNRHCINYEIKAVTYHKLEVRQTSRYWETKVIFDI